MPDQTLPVLGAALPIAALPEYRDWLIDGGRDVEIQDPINSETLDGDWAPLVRQAREQLAGHTGRVGIHGPFDGLTLLSKDRKVRELVAARTRRRLRTRH